MKMAGKTIVSVEIDPIGQIDSGLRFMSPTRRYFKNSRYFNVVFTDKRFELGAKGEVAKEVTGSQSWLIEDLNDSLMLTVTAAIRYVDEQRDKTIDPVLRKSADETLAKLKTLH
jgi:hypothetical protein